MRFFRTFVNVMIVMSTITVWEIGYKQFIKPAISNITSNNEKKDTTDEDEKNKPDVSSVTETPAAKEEPVKSEEKTEEETEKTDKKEVVYSDFATKGFTEIAKNAMNSVVNVATMQIIKEEPSSGLDGFFKGSPFEDMFSDFFGVPIVPEKPKQRKSNSLGSGFLVSVDKEANKAYIVTNNHVVEKATKIVIYLTDKTEIPAELHASDPRTDIAVLSVDTKILGKDIDKLVPVKWGDSDTLEVGAWVVAIGNPFGLGSTLTAGIVSCKGRSIALPGSTSTSFGDDFIQHSAPINMGNSGGCLLDMNGKVVGINNAILSMSGGNIGIGFAIPSNVIKNTVDQLIKEKRTFRGWFGAEIHPVTTKQAESVGIDTGGTLDNSKIFGVFIAKVIKDGPADKAGIKRGDIILEFAGSKISEKNSLQKIVGNTKIDSVAKVKVWRQKEDSNTWKEIVLDLKVGDFEKANESGLLSSVEDADTGKEDQEAEIPELAISIAKIPEKLKKVIAQEFVDNIVVTKVDETKSASFFEPPFHPRDIIVSVDSEEVKTVQKFKNIIKKIKDDPVKSKKPVSFRVVRNSNMFMIATNLSLIDEKSEQATKDDEKKKKKLEDQESSTTKIPQKNDKAKVVR